MPTDLATLRSLDSIDAAILLVVDGLPYAWTNSPQIAGTDYLGDGREIKIGLEAPSLSIGIDVLEGGLASSATSFELMDDETDYLADLFEVFSDPDELDLSIAAGEDLSSRTELHGRWVGTEAIGPAGERNWWPALHDDPGVGRAHVGRDRADGELVPSEVSDRPHLMRGRLVAVYRLFRDVLEHPEPVGDGSDWLPWEQSDRLWIGQLQDSGTVSRRTWSLQADGAASLVRGIVGETVPTRGYRVQTGVSLLQTPGNDQRRIAVRIYSVYSRSTDGVLEDKMWFGQSLFDTEITDLTPSGIRTAVASAINAAKNDAGYHGVIGLNATVGSRNRELDIQFDTWDGSFAIKGLAGERPIVIEADIVMHRTAWLAIGYQPEEQSNRGNWENLEEHYMQFVDTFGRAILVNDPTNTGIPFSVIVPGDGYVVGTISSRSPEDRANGTTDSRSGQGSFVYIRPLYEGGLSGLLPIPGFEFTLDTIDHVYHPGQYDKPIPLEGSTDDTLVLVDGEEADRQGLWMLIGPRRQGDEEFEEIQLLRCAWRSLSSWPDRLATASDGFPRLRVLEVLDPRKYGIDRPPLDGNWAMVRNSEDSVRAYPVFRLGYSMSGPDRFDLVFQRMLLSTGASQGWSVSGGEFMLDTTTNEPDSLSPRLDAEVRSIGLGLPSTLVAPRGEWASVFDGLPPGPYLDSFGLVVRPGIQFEAIFRGLLQSLGLCMGFRNGRIGIFDPTRIVTPSEVDLVIPTARSTGNPSADVTRQELRFHAPITRAVLSYFFDPAKMSFEKENSHRVADPGSYYRKSGDTIEGNGYGIVSDGGWSGRMNDVARFYAKRHFMLRRYPLMRTHGQDAWPGTRVLVSDPHAVSQDGRYGFALYTGVIISKHEETDLDGDGVTVDILIHEQARGGIQLLAPCALSRGIDTDTSRILCHDNWAGISTDGWSDVAQFVEPTWSDLGGNASIEGHWIYSETSSPDWTCTVSGVSTTEGNASISYTGFSGTYLRDRTYLVVMRPYASQSADWVRQLIARIGDEDGLHDGIRSTRWR